MISKINLNDYVQFRIRQDAIDLFRLNPEIKILSQMPDGDYLGQAQFHCLIRAMEGHLQPWLKPPIWCDVEVASQSDAWAEASA